MTQARLKIVPLELKELNALVAQLHRHHQPVQGHRFSIGCIDEANGILVGGASVGRPVSSSTSPKEVLEVTRLVTNGTSNACSCLYSAAARAGKELGYKKIQTFILESEPGVSLIAAGWKLDGVSSGHSWDHAKRKRRTDQPIGPKSRYAKELNK